MKKHDATRPSFPGFDNVLADLSPEERQEAEERLIRYIELVIRIGNRLKEESQGNVPTQALTSNESDSSISSTSSFHSQDV